MIFSKSYCPYCKKAKEAFTERKIDFKAIELDDIPNGSEIQAALLKLTGQRTVPNIFIKGSMKKMLLHTRIKDHTYCTCTSFVGKHLGGCDDTLAAFQSGKLTKMLE
jgi:glutaredoxin 3